MKQLESELEELKKKHLLEKHEQEVELRKMLTILNSRPAKTKEQKKKIGSIEASEKKIYRELFGVAFRKRRKTSRMTPKSLV